MSENFDCSIVICTYNRAKSLAHSLKCIASQRVPGDISWEVIIVDNNSNDDTAEIVREARARYDQIVLRYVFEPTQGLAHARNKGLSEALGRIVLFTDDDVCPEPDWLAKIWEGMKQYKCDACGGYIKPDWETPPPKWLTERFYGFLAVRIDKNGPRQIYEVGEAPYGANMAFRREVFDQVGLFDTTRGRKGIVLASGEDGELFERILAAGLTVMYFPQARVKHRVEAFRLRRSYFRRWRFQSSRNIAHSRGLPGNRRFMGIPLYLFPQLMRAIARAAIARLRSPVDEAFHREIIVWHFFGLIIGLWDNHRHNL